MSKTWTYREDEKLLKLYREGKSFSEIEKMIPDRTRCAIGSRLDRLGERRSITATTLNPTARAGAEKITLPGPAWSVKNIPNCQHVGDVK